jgi:alpha-ketoglutarate-dependent taurine dioxygenase
MNLSYHQLAETFGTIVESLSDDNILELAPSEVNDLLRDSSLILFRGFDLNTEKFKEFSNSLCQDFLAYVGGAYSRDMINEDKTLLSVTGHKLHFAVPFHGEMYYKKHKPEIMWFYCATPAVKDGETTICDGIKVFDHLSLATRDLFTNNRIKYIRTYIDGSWQKIYQTENLTELEQICQENDLKLIVNEDKSITTEYLCSGLIDSRCGNYKVFINNILPVCEQEAEGKPHSKVRWEDGSKISDEVITEIKQVTDELTFLVDWHKQDLVVFDNKRLMHGRKAFADNERDIYVRMGNPIFAL